MSAVPTSSVLLSITVSVSVVQPVQAVPTAVKRGIQDVPAEQWKRQSPSSNETAELDDLSGFFGESGLDHPSVCSSAVLFFLSDGQLESDRGAVSVEPGVPYMDLVEFTGGSISTTFEIDNGMLVWRNESFFDGQAGFCQMGTGLVYAVFEEDAAPVNCTSIDIVVYEAVRLLPVSSPDLRQERVSCQHQGLPQRL
ncbi:hypothetical protein KJ359_006387 [Pestalotiopsis sp. 9143b]|nr:hypothetical protein KJ359_006387 [Pestalotiopsis sp. 9143b]